tara:strand:- start:376 stop:750 length:375 start_codon:yes stop_codon:yes gene_type:complete
MTDQFKRSVVEYCDIDDKIKEFNASIKEAKEKQKMMSELIMDYMSKNSLDVCNAGEYGIITMKTTVSKSGVNKDSVKESLAKMLSDRSLMAQDMDSIVENGSDLIMNNRESVERNTLKRSRMKK